MAHLLLIDDEPALIYGQVRQAFPAPWHRVEIVNNREDGIASVRNNAREVILVDVLLPDQPGLRVYERIREIEASIPVILSSSKPPRSRSYACPSCWPRRLRSRIRARALRRLQRDARRVQAVGRVAANNVPVLITGERGTGKELVARAVYQHSERAKVRSWRTIAPQSRSASLE